MKDQDLQERFTYHPPKDDVQKLLYEHIRAKGFYFAQYVNENVPDSPEKERAIQAIQEAVMFSNAAIAIFG